MRLGAGPRLVGEVHEARVDGCLNCGCSTYFIAEQVCGVRGCGATLCSAECRDEHLLSAHPDRAGP